jgi:hypothetical protein
MIIKVHNKLYRNSFPTFIDLVNKGNFTQIRMCAMYKDCMLHQATLSNLVLYMHYFYNKELQPLFIDKHVSCKAHPWSPIFKIIVGHFLPHDLHDISGLFSSKWCGMIPRSQQLGEPSYASMFCPHDACHFTHVLPPWSCHFTHVLPVHKTIPTACFAASAVESFVYLRQSFVQVLDCAKSSPWLAQAAARCRICICVQAANSCAAEFASACRLPMSSLSNSSTAPVLVCLCP